MTALKAIDKPTRALDKARREAHKILHKFGYALPVNINAIVEAHNISVRAEALEDSVSGMLVIKDGNAVIGVNMNHHPNRQRFTIAHELGHYLLHSNSSKIFIDAAPIFFRDETSSNGSRSQEIQANTFAAELLMPDAILKEQLRTHPLDPFDDMAVRRLASQFEVSVQALTIRLTKLGLTAA